MLLNGHTVDAHTPELSLSPRTRRQFGSPVKQFGSPVKQFGSPVKQFVTPVKRGRMSVKRGTRNDHQLGLFLRSSPSSSEYPKSFYLLFHTPGFT